MQMPEMAGRQPDAVIACVGGGSNAMGIFYPYIDDARRAADRRRSRGRGHRHRPPCGIADARAGPACCTAIARICCRTRTARSSRRIRSRRASTIPASARSTRGSRTPAAPSMSSITDDEALAAFHDCCRIEGIIPALESAHALAYATKLAPTLPRDKILLVNLSGRGDKDMAHGRRAFADDRLRSAIEARDEPASTHVRMRLRTRDGRTALIPYVTAGDPSLATTRRRSCTRWSRRRRLIELGVPFSDPMADGPVVQRASERALAQGVGLPTCSTWWRVPRGGSQRRRSC